MHRCFLALSNNDLERVSVTSLEIYKAIHTGPVYGSRCYNYFELGKSHHKIQWRYVLGSMGLHGGNSGLATIRSGNGARDDEPKFELKRCKHEAGARNHVSRCRGSRL